MDVEGAFIAFVTELSGLVTVGVEPGAFWGFLADDADLAFWSLTSYLGQSGTVRHSAIENPRGVRKYASEVVFGESRWVVQPRLGPCDKAQRTALGLLAVCAAAGSPRLQPDANARRTRRLRHATRLADGASHQGDLCRAYCALLILPERR